MLELLLDRGNGRRGACGDWVIVKTDHENIVWNANPLHLEAANDTEGNSVVAACYGVKGRAGGEELSRHA